MNRERLKGNLDLLLLSVLAAGPGHGYAIIAALRDRSGGTFDLPEGTVYPALHRLEDAGLLASSWADVNGRRRRVYGLTEQGAAALAAEQTEWRRFAVSVQAVVGWAGMSDPRDRIEEYLSDLRASLELAPQEAELVVAEAEDHLRETAACGLATGMTEHEAQLAAISAFGPVTAVVRAHAARPAGFIRGRTPAAILGDLILAGWKLAGTGLIAVGVSGLVVLLMNLVFGRAFTGQAPASVSFQQSACAYWLGLWPGAHTCATAHTLEASSDAVVLRAGAGVMGAALLAAYGIARYVQRRRGRGPVVVLAGYFPLLAAGVFGAGALGLALAQLFGFTITQGPGTYLSGAIVAAAAAAWYGRKARPAIRHLMREWTRYAAR